MSDLFGFVYNRAKILNSKVPVTLGPWDSGMQGNLDSRATPQQFARFFMIDWQPTLIVRRGLTLSLSITGGQISGSRAERWSELAKARAAFGFENA